MTQTSAQPSPQPPVAKKDPRRAHAPRRHVRGQLRMAAGQGIRGGRGPAQGGKHLPGGGDRAPGTAARGHLPGNQGPHPGNRPLRPQPQGRLVVLHPLGRGQGVRDPLPRAGPGHRGPRRGLDSPGRGGRRQHPRRGSPARWQPRGGGQAVLRRGRRRHDHRRHPRMPTPWTTPGTSASRCASRTSAPARCCRT